MTPESTLLDPLVHNPSNIPVRTGDGAIGGQAQPAKPRQLVIECKLSGCDIALELRTHGKVIDGAHRWTQLSGSARLQPPKSPLRTRVVFVMNDLPDCRVEKELTGDCVWIGGAAFDIDSRDVQRMTDWLVALGVEVQDHTKGGGS
jgi:hypothetical protein